MRRNALIGHTGFVGGTLARQHDFRDQFNSKNIACMVGREFDTVVCAAAPGSMFTANRDPHRDRAQIQSLIDILGAIRVHRFILISSIAVFSDFAGRDDEDSRRFQEQLAYGRHRRELEVFVENNFRQSLVVRLPALFGPGLRKNMLFDLLNPIPSMLTKEKLVAFSTVLKPTLVTKVASFYAFDPATGMMKLDRAALNADPIRGILEEAATTHGFAATQFHNPDTTYQYYNMSRLWPDICTALDASLSHVHLVSEPLKVSTIFHRLVGREMPENGARLHHEDMQTRHGSLWGRQGPYLDDASNVLDQLAVFFAGERRGLA